MLAAVRAFLADTRTWWTLLVIAASVGIMDDALSQIIGSLDGSPLPSWLPASLGRAFALGFPALLASVTTMVGTVLSATNASGNLSARRAMLGPYLVLFGIGLVALVLAPYTAGLAVAVYAFCCLYVPLAASEGARPLAAVAASASFALSKPWRTIVALLAPLFAGALGAGITAPVWRGHLFAAILAQVLLQAGVALASLAAVLTWRTSSRNAPSGTAV
jgi:hypothetical protein